MQFSLQIKVNNSVPNKTPIDLKRNNKLKNILFKTTVYIVYNNLERQLINNTYYRYGQVIKMY